MGSRLVQYMAMVSGILLLILSGINLGWPSPYLPLLDENNPAEAPMKLTNSEQFWCSVMPLVGAPPGALLAALFVDRIGRKYCLLTLSPIAFASFMAIGFTHSVIILDTARFIVGSVEGALFTITPMYFGEIADPQIRGLMSGSILIGSCFGLLFINIVGSYISIFMSSMIICAIPVIHFLTFIWMPRSPYYLMKRNYLEEARRSLRKLRGTKEIDKEFSEILAAVKRQEAISQEKSAKYTDLFTQPGNRKAVIIYLVLAFANKFCGANPIVFFAHSIFSEAKGFISPEYAVMTFHIIGFTTIFGGMIAADKLGRRPLMLFSTFGSTLALAVFSTFFTMKYLNMEIVDDISWVPVVSLACFSAIYNVGIALGPVILISELFPTSVKGYACSSGDSISVIIATVVTKIFHGLVQFGMYVPLWLFTACGFLGTILIYIYLPETKGKTLEEIQLELTGEKKAQDLEEK